MEIHVGVPIMVHLLILFIFIHMFSSVINVIETIIEDALDSIQRVDENILIGLLQIFELCLIYI